MNKKFWFVVFACLFVTAFILVPAALKADDVSLPPPPDANEDLVPPPPGDNTAAAPAPGNDAALPPPPGDQSAAPPPSDASAPAGGDNGALPPPPAEGDNSAVAPPAGGEEGALPPPPAEGDNSTAAQPPAAPPAEEQAAPPAEQPAQEEGTLQGTLKKYSIKRGNSLWKIASMDEVYNDSFKWPLIFKANRATIDDPDIIYPKQVLKISRSFSQEEIDDAVGKAKETPAYEPHSKPRKKLPIKY